MLKKIIFILMGYFSLINLTFAGNPEIHCKGLPGCSSDTSFNVVVGFSENLVANLIKFVAVFAVLSLVISGIMYIISGGDDGKTKKAKNRIIWSLVGVFLSISAWSIINMINNFTLYPN